MWEGDDPRRPWVKVGCAEHKARARPGEISRKGKRPVPQTGRSLLQFSKAWRVFSYFREHREIWRAAVLPLWFVLVRQGRPREITWSTTGASPASVIASCCAAP
jgi:hypothetical protein